MSECPCSYLVSVPGTQGTGDRADLRQRSNRNLVKKIVNTFLVTGCLILAGVGCGPVSTDKPTSEQAPATSTSPLQQETTTAKEDEQYLQLNDFIIQTRAVSANKAVPHLALGFHGDDGRTEKWAALSSEKKASLLEFLQTFEDKDQLVFVDVSGGYELYVVARDCDEYTIIEKRISQFSLKLESRVWVKEDGEKTPLDKCLAGQYFD